MGSYLLKADGGYLLQANGSRIILPGLPVESHLLKADGGYLLQANGSRIILSELPVKQLLGAIKTQLQTDLTYVRSSDIYVTEDELLVPSSVRFPAIALKDGPINYAIATQSQDTDELFVKIIAYVQLQKAEASVMGDASTSKKGVLEIIANVITSLKNNRLSGQADSASPVAETESSLLADEETAIQMKTVTMRYMRY